MAESFPGVAVSAPEHALDPRPDEWAQLDATAQAALVRRGELSPRELTLAACERIAPLALRPVRRHVSRGGREAFRHPASSA